MSILAFLDEESDKAVIYKLKSDKKEDLLKILKDYFKHSYICPENYGYLRGKDLTHQEIMGAKLPTEGRIKSGEFGEIITNKLLEELNVNARSIKKWRWKEDKNKPVQKIDVVLLESDPENPQQTDKLIVAEVKASATPKAYSQIQNAINDIVKEQEARLAKALIWVKDRAVGEADTETMKLIDRFIKSSGESVGDFTIEKNAYGVIDKDLLQADIDQVDFENKDSEINVVVVTMEKLKETYEELYKKIHDEA